MWQKAFDNIQYLFLGKESKTKQKKMQKALTRVAIGLRTYVK